METQNEIKVFIEKLKCNNNNIKNYIESLNAIDHKALEIAIEELESSFNIEKSIGFIEYMKSNEHLQT